MTETTGGVPGAEARCPWCSSSLPVAAERCPSCGAAVRAAAATGDDIPGVTQVDPVLGFQRQIKRPNRLVGWLADVDIEPTPTTERASGAAAPDVGDALQGADATSVAPPSSAVRREMRRLELEALKAELEARAAEARLIELDSAEPPAGAAEPLADASAPPAGAAPSADQPSQDAEGPAGA